MLVLAPGWGTAPPAGLPSLVWIECQTKERLSCGGAPLGHQPSPNNVAHTAYLCSGLRGAPKRWHATLLNKNEHATQGPCHGMPPLLMIVALPPYTHTHPGNGIRPTPTVVFWGGAGPQNGSSGGARTAHIGGDCGFVAFGWCGMSVTLGGCEGLFV